LATWTDEVFVPVSFVFCANDPVAVEKKNNAATESINEEILFMGSK
jgi:hypothetical protein